jgi:hypothetical protein
MKTILAVSTILIFTAVGARAEEWRLEYVGGYERAVIERPLAGLTSTRESSSPAKEAPSSSSESILHALRRRARSSLTMALRLR